MLLMTVRWQQLFPDSHPLLFLCPVSFHRSARDRPSPGPRRSSPSAAAAGVRSATGSGLPGLFPLLIPEGKAPSCSSASSKVPTGLWIKVETLASGSSSTSSDTSASQTDAF